MNAREKLTALLLVLLIEWLNRYGMAEKWQDTLAEVKTLIKEAA